MYPVNAAASRRRPLAAAASHAQAPGHQRCQILTEGADPGPLPVKGNRPRTHGALAPVQVPPDGIEMAKRPREGLHLLEQRLTHRPQALQPGGLLGRAGLPHERMIERRGKVAQVRPKERGFLAQHPVAQPRPRGSGRSFR